MRGHMAFAEAGTPGGVSPNRQFRVLVVDEDPLQREAVRLELVRAGFEAIGIGFVRTVVDQRFDLVVMRGSLRETPDDIVRQVHAALQSARDEVLDDILEGPDGLVMSQRSRHVAVDGRPVALTPKAFDVLRILLERRGEILSVDQIALAVWGYATLGSPNFVEAQISRVRSRLATAGRSDMIWTIRGVGYMIRE